MSKPFFSIIILFWQSEQYLPESLRSLEQQSFRDFEVILLDNGAVRPVDPDLLAEHPALNIRLLRSETNLGFAGGNNLAAREARGEYLVLLNGDAFPAPDWLEVLHTASLRRPGHFFASRLVKNSDPQLLDGEWNVYHASGLAWRKNHDQPVSRAETREKEVFSACAAAGAYPREAFAAIGGFDEDFFAYMEDLDLDFRLQLQGLRCLYLPQAVVRHVGSGSTSARSDFSVYHGHRNLVWCFVKNMPGALFWLLLPAHVIINLAYLLVSFFMPSGASLRRGKRDALRGLRQAWASRREVQAGRKVTIWRIARRLNWNPLAPLVKLTFK